MEEKSPDRLPVGWISQTKVRENGKKYMCYIDPSTGRKFFSKRKVFDYLETIKLNGYQSKQKKRDAGIRSLTKVEVEKVTDDELPSGWIKEIRIKKAGDKIRRDSCYIAPSTGCKFYSKRKVFDYLETMKQNSSPSEKKKRGTCMLSLSNVEVEKVTDGELPPGWIKEIKITRTGNKIRRDPYFTDPVSQFVFRSKKDVFRYLKTGNPGRCRIKPKKRANYDMESSVKITPPSAAKRRKLAGSTTKRQLFAGQSSNLNEKIEDEQILQSSVMEECVPLAVVSSDQCGKSTDLGGLAMLESEGLKKSLGKGLEEKREVVAALAAELPLKKLPSEKNEIQSHGSRSIRRGSKSTKDTKKLIFPRRTSKRLAGIEAAPGPDLWTSGRACRVGGRQSDKVEPNTSEHLAPGSCVQGTSHRLDKSNLSCAPHLSGSTVPSDNQTPNGSGKLCISLVAEMPSNKVLSNETREPFGVQSTSENHAEKLEAGEKPESPLVMPFGDSWPDPVLEFAFKTLTGAIPVDDSLEIENYFQQKLSSPPTHRDGELELPDFGSAGFSQTDPAIHFGAAEQLPSRIPSENMGLPSPGKNIPHQPGREGMRKRRR